MIYLVIAALAVVALCVALPSFRRNHRLDEVDRFHVARSLTSTWATGPQPAVRVAAQGDEYQD